jgi:hypothetical protein
MWRYVGYYNTHRPHRSLPRCRQTKALDMWRSPAPAGDLASPDPPLRPEGRSASAPSRHELRRALVCLEPLPKGRSRPIDGLEGWRRHAGRLCSRIGSVNALLVEVCRRDQPSFVDTPSFVRSFCREPFVRWFVGSRHNPLGLGRSEPIGGRFPRYCSRFPSLLRRQRSWESPGQRPRMTFSVPTGVGPLSSPSSRRATCCTSGGVE